MWDQMYGGIKDERAALLIQVTDGGFLIAGSTRSYGNGNWDAWLLKTDPNANYSRSTLVTSSLANSRVDTLPKFTITFETQIIIIIGAVLTLIKLKRKNLRHKQNV